MNNGREQFANFLRGIEGNGFTTSTPQTISANYEVPQQQIVVEPVVIAETADGE